MLSDGAYSLTHKTLTRLGTTRQTMACAKESLPTWFGSDIVRKTGPGQDGSDGSEGEREGDEG